MKGIIQYIKFNIGLYGSIISLLLLLILGYAHVHNHALNVLALCNEQDFSSGSKLEWEITQDDTAILKGNTRTNRENSTTVFYGIDEAALIVEDAHLYLNKEGISKLQQFNLPFTLIKDIVAKSENTATTYIYFNSLNDYRNNATLDLSEDIWLKWEQYVQKALTKSFAQHMKKKNVKLHLPNNITDLLCYILGQREYTITLNKDEMRTLLNNVNTSMDDSISKWLTDYLKENNYSLEEENQTVLEDYTRLKYTTLINDLIAAEPEITWNLYAEALKFSFSHDISLILGNTQYKIQSKLSYCKVETTSLPNNATPYQLILDQNSVEKVMKDGLYIPVESIKQNLINLHYIEDKAMYTSSDDIRYTKKYTDGTDLHIALVPDENGMLTNMRIQCYFPFASSKTNSSTNYGFLTEFFTTITQQKLAFLDTLIPAYEQTMVNKKSIWNANLYSTHYLSLNTKYSPQNDSLVLYATFTINYKPTNMEELIKELYEKLEASGEADLIRERIEQRKKELEKRENKKLEEEQQAQELATEFANTTLEPIPNTLWGISSDTTNTQDELLSDELSFSVTQK